MKKIYIFKKRNNKFKFINKQKKKVIKNYN